MNEEQKLYVEQMKHWIHEQEILRQQIKRTVDHHEEMAQSNREQLKLHNTRVEAGIKQYDQWLKDNGIFLVM